MLYQNPLKFAGYKLGGLFLMFCVKFGGYSKSPKTEIQRLSDT